MSRVEGNNGDMIDAERHEHEEYLAAFKRSMIEKLRTSIDKDLAHDPDGGKGYENFPLLFSFIYHY